MNTKLFLALLLGGAASYYVYLMWRRKSQGQGQVVGPVPVVVQPSVVYGSASPNPITKTASASDLIKSPVITITRNSGIVRYIKADLAPMSRVKVRVLRNNSYVGSGTIAYEVKANVQPTEVTLDEEIAVHIGDNVQIFFSGEGSWQYHADASGFIVTEIGVS